jgi:2-methylcitrate dehydratase PrpD
MTTIDEILALAAHAAPTSDADADLALFAAAVPRGMNSAAVRALRALRPDGRAPAWRAWLSATAAVAGTPADPIEGFVVCAAATACGDDCSAAVTAGIRATALVRSRLTAPNGWSVPTVSAVIGAGLAAGLMLRLPPEGLRHALGICATQAAGLHAAVGTDAGPLQAGKAAFNAVEAAQLARLGFTSSSDPLDGRRALFALFAR